MSFPIPNFLQRVKSDIEELASSTFETGCDVTVVGDELHCAGPSGYVRLGFDGPRYLVTRVMDDGTAVFPPLTEQADELGVRRAAWAVIEMRRQLGP